MHRGRHLRDVQLQWWERRLCDDYREQACLYHSDLHCSVYYHSRLPWQLGVFYLGVLRSRHILRSSNSICVSHWSAYSYSRHGFIGVGNIVSRADAGYDGHYSALAAYRGKSAGITTA